MNLFPKAACAVTEIRQHPAFVYYSTSELRTGPDYGRSVLLKAFAAMVDANPGRYANGLSLEAFVSDFPSHPVAMDCLEILTKMRVYKVVESDLIPCKRPSSARAQRITTCISLPTHVLDGLKLSAAERGISVSALITKLWSNMNE